MIDKEFRTIGGYFELEVSKELKNKKGTTLLNSGRAALKHILSIIKPTSICIPYFACKVVRETIDELEIPISFYKINASLEIDEPIKENHNYLYINFFGLKREYVQKISAELKEKLIIDNTHDLFFDNINCPNSYQFNSLRKFIGVPDGAQLYAPEEVKLNLDKFPLNKISNPRHLLMRLDGDIEGGYNYFQAHEAEINSKIKRASHLTQEILKSLDLELIQKKRIKNYQFLQERLFSTNKLEGLLDNTDNTIAPFSYPYISKHALTHTWFWGKKIYAAKLWTECEGNSNYKYADKYSKSIIHLPIDQRYDLSDMEYITQLILKYGK